MENTEQQTVENKEEVLAPEMQAVHYLMGAIPAFKRQLDRLTGVQAKNVLMAIIESPLEQHEHNFTTNESRNLFELGLNIESHKFLLFNTGLKNEQLVDEVLEQAKEENKEKENG